MSAFTAKQMTIGKAPRMIQLFGDKTRKVKSAQHIIEFPGGAIEVSRCTDGSYWAHIIVNHGFGDGDGDGLSSANGAVMNSRIVRDGEHVQSLGECERITQIAVRIERAA
ncbi:hypothetical protein WMO32_10405 [Xanthomonas oryzae pv. oryzicola]|uniref:Uncharacterized protein n=2 Tax=Xanthomonas oryzae TaxID=347 RepID=G7THG8_XANOB|nr:hypothetical protein [Xanthomonas oryzae]AEQ96752.1 hypothetical protein XOC_2642 [Xanthomonas oryzae pv. oryzicola BLS256]AJQ87832.1 hypothetical protein BE73_12770 [Xanthomonas oryzae pv. oryzicola]AKK64268.1 hypothetical protein FE36_10730 [Xanthomonas oryzae pv. oryzicola]AKN93200.1 hypothetical protein ACU13_09300 [Xanthomonas oryzae pv. oryzicola]AKN96929.1 hypothetical protein ACU10_09240 [Xanthomonas oryzae pv. oryzicola]